jgi:alpha-ribazole phosphatase
MEIFLIRHTAPDVEKGVCYGQADVPLKDTFLQEAAALMPLVPTDAGAIYTSPLARCAQLARYIANPLGLPVLTDDRLKELHFGLWELQAWNAIEPALLQPWMDNYVETTCPGGESYRVLADRTGAFLKSLAMSAHERVIVVTHHGVIKAMSAILLGISLEEAMALSFGYGSVTRYFTR